MIENLKTANQLALGQSIGLLKLLPDEVYRTKLATLHGHSVGQHTRHILEFYQCLLQQAASSRVCYDDRRRDAHIEADLGHALACAEELWDQLAQPLTDRELWIENHSAPGAIASSLARELVYLIEHTIHHLAIIKIGLNQGYPHLVLPVNLGVAPSTLLYRDKILEQA